MRTRVGRVGWRPIREYQCSVDSDRCGEWSRDERIVCVHWLSARLFPIDEPLTDDGAMDLKTRMHQNIAGRLSSLAMKPAPQSSATVKQARPPLPLAELFDNSGRSVATLTCDAEMGMISIGRSQDAALHVPDKGVSRYHASLGWDPAMGAHVLADCGSVNGTYLNRRRITGRVTLLDGARITLGTTDLLYRRRHD